MKKYAVVPLLHGAVFALTYDALRFWHFPDAGVDVCEMAVTASDTPCDACDRLIAAGTTAYLITDLADGRSVAVHRDCLPAETLLMLEVAFGIGLAERPFRDQAGPNVPRWRGKPVPLHLND